MPRHASRIDPAQYAARLRSMPALVARGFRALTAAILIAAAGAASAQASDATPSLRDMWAAKDWNAPEPWRTDRWYFQTSILTIHFHPDDDHQQSILLDSSYYFQERWLEGQVFAGLSLFTNSFGQFSQYLYAGLKWRPWKEYQEAYVKLSAGLVHGYRGEYQDKIPFNHYGVAPGIIPSVGYCWTRYCGEFVLLGFNAALITVGVTIP